MFSCIFFSRKRKKQARAKVGRPKVEQLNLLILFQQLISRKKKKKRSSNPMIFKITQMFSFQCRFWGRITFPGLNLRRKSV